MKFTINKDIFLKGLTRIQGIIEKRNTIPVLSNVLIEAHSEQLSLTATDLEVGIKSTFNAKILEPGKVTVSAKKLYEIVKELPENEIHINSKENSWIEIKCGKSIFNLVGLSADEFPHFPIPEKNGCLEITSNLCKEMIDKTLYSISTDESKYNLNGIYINRIENSSKLRMVATDGHRLSMIDKEISEILSEELDKGVILPRKGLLEIKKISEDGDDTISLGFMDNNAIVTKKNVVIIMRLVDGEFPDYKRVIPNECKFSAIIDSDQIFHSLRRMIILANETSRGVKLIFDINKLEISSSNPELGEAKEYIDIEYDGPQLTIGFNAKYLLDILQSQEQNKIVMLLNDQTSPCIIKPYNDDGFTSVVMPMKL